MIESELERLSDKMDEVAAKKIRPQDKIIELIYTHLNMIKETVMRNGNLRAAFFRNIWMVEKVRKNFDEDEIELFRKVYADGKLDGEFDIDNVELVADITHYCIKGLEVPFICGRLGHGMTPEPASRLWQRLCMVRWASRCLSRRLVPDIKNMYLKLSTTL